MERETLIFLDQTKERYLKKNKRKKKGKKKREKKKSKKTPDSLFHHAGTLPRCYCTEALRRIQRFANRAKKNKKNKNTSKKERARNSTLTGLPPLSRHMA
jgi:hypothetical protein